MDAVGPDRPDEGPDWVSRRRLLRLASGIGLASVVSACSSQAGMDSAPKSAGAPRQASTPSPAAASTTGASQPKTPPSAPTTSPPSALSTTSARMICRDAWGARPARPGGRPHTITRMTLHHEAVVLGQNRNAPSHLRQDQRYHQDQLGWIDIAYHVGVDRNGNIYELRSTEIAGDTATGTSIKRLCRRPSFKERLSRSDGPHSSLASVPIHWRAIGT